MNGEATPTATPDRRAELDREGYFDLVYPDELKPGDKIPGIGKVAAVDFTPLLEVEVTFDTETPGEPTPVYSKGTFDHEEMARQLRVWRRG